MRQFFIIYFIIFFTQCTQNHTEDFCKKVQKKAINQIHKGNIEPIFETSSPHSDVERYYIWKKFGVNVEFILPTHEFYQIELDSCYNSIMLQHTKNKDQIQKSLDSLILEYHENKNSFLTPVFGYKFHDGKYYISPVKHNKYAPRIIDTTFYAQLDKFQSAFISEISDTVRCAFWYEIDTTGVVKNVEVYHHINPKIDSAVVKFFKSFKYTPAHNGKEKLMYRNHDFIYFLGTKED